jgi:hypothetical protein
MALARSHGRTLTLPELSKLASVPLRTLSRISKQPSWGNIKVSTMHAILTACKVDIINQAKARAALRKSVLGRRHPFASLLGSGLAAHSRERRRQAVFQLLAKLTA